MGFNSAFRGLNSERTGLFEIKIINSGCFVLLDVVEVNKGTAIIH